MMVLLQPAVPCVGEHELCEGFLCNELRLLLN